MTPLFHINRAEALAQSEFGKVTVLGETAQAHAAVALSGARTLVAILSERKERGLKFGSHVETGLVNALATCVEVAHELVHGVGSDAYPLDVDDGQQVLELAIDLATGGQPK